MSKGYLSHGFTKMKNHLIKLSYINASLKSVQHFNEINYNKVTNMQFERTGKRETVMINREFLK